MQPIDKDIRDKVLETDGNIAISASAGTGKTYLTVQRIIIDSKKVLDYHTFAAITFTRKAAREIQSRLGTNKGDGFVGTNDNFVLREIIQPFMYDLYGAEFKKEIKPDYSNENAIVNFSEGIDIIMEKGLICKYRNQRINFAFQLSLDIMKRSRAAKRYFRSKYNRIYIDEYQDSDKDMHMLFMYICMEVGIPLFIVGDIKQSIYGWRGGYCDGFKSILIDDRFTPFILKHNFRSNLPIQNYSNIFMEDVRQYLQECEINDEVIGYRYDNESAAIEYINNWIDQDKRCALLARSNANADRWSELIAQSGLDFVFIPSSPLDNNDLESEHVWIVRLLALYLLQDRFSEYDVWDEIPSSESYELRVIKKYLKCIALNKEIFSDFFSACFAFYNFLGYPDNNEKVENEIKKLYEVINDDKYISTYNSNKYIRVASTIHAAKWYGNTFSDKKL